MVDEYANVNTDWFKLLFKNSITQQHTLSVFFRNEKAQSYVSTSFFSDPGWSVTDNVKKLYAELPPAIIT